MAKQYDLSEIKTISNLTVENVEKICKVYYNLENVHVERPFLQSDISDFFETSSTKTAENFNSDLKKISFNVQVTHPNGTVETNALNWVIKVNKTTFLHRWMSVSVTSMKLFFKECFWYKVLAPILVESDKELKTILPDFYHIYSNLLEDAQNRSCFKTPIKFDKGMLILDNLGAKKHDHDSTFRVVDKTGLMDFHHFKMAFEALALFHGSMWNFFNSESAQNHQDIKERVLKAFKAPKMSKFFRNWVVENYWIKPMNNVVQLCENRKLDEDVIKKLKKYASGYGRKMFSSILTNTCEPSRSSLVTLTHCDTWSNNLMFSYDESGKPSKIKLIDYQLMCIYEPYRDLQTLMNVHSDGEFRKSNLENLLKCYYDKLSKTIGEDKIPLSFEQFKEGWNRQRGVSICYATTYLPSALAVDKITIESLSDMNRVLKDANKRITDPDKEDDHPNTRELRRRLIDIILELFDEGEFDKE